MDRYIVFWGRGPSKIYQPSGIWRSSAPQKSNIDTKNGHTVEGWNPKQPPGMYKTLWRMEYLPYQLVQDFFHQPYPKRVHIFQSIILDIQPLVFGDVCHTGFPQQYSRIDNDHQYYSRVRIWKEEQGFCGWKSFVVMKVAVWEGSKNANVWWCCGICSMNSALFGLVIQWPL